MTDKWEAKPRNLRGPHDSSTEFGQHVHDNFRRNFNAIDRDREVFISRGGLTTFARSTGILRYLEHFYPGGTLSAAENEMLPLYAAMFWYGKHYGIVDPDSGVFTIESGPPFTSGIVQELRWTPTGGYVRSDPRELEGADFARFIGTYDGTNMEVRNHAA